MAVGFVLDFEGWDQADYEQVMRAIGLDSQNAQWPSGIISHCAGPTDKGSWRVVDYWESREDFERFYHDRLQRALQTVGKQGAEPQWFQVYNLHQERTDTSHLRRAA